MIERIVFRPPTAGWVRRRDRASVNCHPVRHRTGDCGHLGRVLVLLEVGHLPLRDVRLETLVEVGCAHGSDDDCDQEQKDGDDGEGRKRTARGQVIGDTARVGTVHAHKLEEEIGKRAEVDGLHQSQLAWCMGSFATYNNGTHAYHTLLLGPVRRQQQEDDCDGNGSNGEVEFGIGSVADNDKELHGESQEEEEIELEEGDVDLEANVSTCTRYYYHQGTPLTWYVRYLRFSLRSALMCL